jgi:hypothetical protein
MLDEKTKEKLFMLLIMVMVALSFIYKIPKMIEAWEASTIQLVSDTTHYHHTL